MDDSPASNAIASENRVRCAVDVTAAAWLLQAADLDGARRLIASALAAAPHDVRARALLGQVLFRQRDFVGASEVFERLLGEFPGDVPLLFNLALCHLKGGRPGPAAATFRAIVKSRPDHARARAWLRVAEAATPGPPPVIAPEPPPDPPSRTSTRPSRLEELPRVSLPPDTAFARDESGVVTLRLDDATRWVVRRSALEGYSGRVAQEAAAHRAGFVALAGEGTALLRTPGALVVLELRAEETGARASMIAAYATSLAAEVADPESVGDFGEAILRLTGTGPVVLEARAELTALPVSLTHATTVRWDHVVGWSGHVIGAPSSQVDAEGRTLARFAGNGSLLLAMHDEAPPAALASYGRCEVIRRLGGGPRDEVLLARSSGPGGFRRKVVLERRLAGGDDARPIERLAREAHAYALLAHPAIARLFDFLLVDGHPVIVREYVSGVAFAELVAATNDRDARASIALHVAHGVLSALAAAHEACDPDTGDVVPLVHGDVRAGCVLVAWSGDVKLAGFAAARLEAGRPPTMKSDVRAAVRLVADALGPRAEATMAIEALVARAGGAPRARQLAEAIAEAVDLDDARSACLDVLAALRERQGGGAPSSLPPPAVDADDSRFFHRRFPKPSPVPDLVTEPPPVDAPIDDAPEEAPIDSYETPPPVQPPSIDPAATPSRAAPGDVKRRRFATAIAAAIVAAASGLASIDGARSERTNAAPPVAIEAPTAHAVASAPTPAPPASSALPAAIEVAPIALAEPPHDGRLRVPARARQHRVYVDGRVVGEGPGEYAIACGAHAVRVGSHGRELRIDVPCGGAVDLE